MAESKSVCVYLPVNIRKELDDMMAKDEVDNTSLYIKDAIHLAHLVGGVRALEKRIIGGTD